MRALNKSNLYVSGLFLVILIVNPGLTIPIRNALEANPISNLLIPTSTSTNQPPEMRDIAPVQQGYSVSDTHTPSPATGTLNPIKVEQKGYSQTDNISARTDTKANTKQIIEIDTSHDWMASIADVSLANLKKIYAENGTFDEGYPGANLNPTGDVAYHPLGWDATSTTTDIAQSQLATFYIGTESYVMVENQGTPVGPSGDRDYRHSVDTNILWTQTATNNPYNENFILSFRYLYFRGPIGAILSGNCSLVVYIDGSPVWNRSLLVVERRGLWFDSGKIPISQEGIGSTFTIEIGVVIDETMTLDPNTDYDSDGLIDGIENTYFITAFFDDLSFESASSPNCDEVDLGLSVNGSSAPIVGSGGIGFGQIENELYWDISILEFSITSNTSVSFTFIARLLNHRFLNSCWTTDTLEYGVAYTIESGKSGNLELYTYLGFLEEYKELTLTMHHPYDWVNVTVFDPFLSDVTSICSCNEESVIIPEAISNRLGWWKFTLNSINYASASVLERYDANVSSWVNQSVFHSFDSARLNVSIGTVNDVPDLSNPIYFSWGYPNCSIWEETSSIGDSGTATSSAVVFGQTNTTAGIWGVKFLWTNGSEIAYSCQPFELHHKAVLELIFSETLETFVSQPVTVVLRFVDTENGMLILNDDASIVGHWIGSDVEFNADIVNNWWQADFDTSQFGAGNFTIDIVSYTHCFETDSLKVSISSYFLTSLEVPTGPMTALVYGRQYNFEYTYSMFHNNTGIDGATVEVFEEGSEWTTIENTGNGHYILSLLPMNSEDYSIRIRFSKGGFDNQTHVLSFLVHDVEIEVGSISTLVGTEQIPLRIEVQIVESDTGNLISNANVTLAIYRPGDYLYSDILMDEESPGAFSTSIVMPSADSGTYTVRISVEKENHHMAQDFSATLVPIFDFNSRLVGTLITYPWQIGIIAALAISTVLGQKARIGRRREKHMSAMEFKHRLNDANNILGIIVLHRLSGIPIYSQVFKSGFEEGLLSAFITAIMQFREAIDAGTPDNYTLVPISEVMRVVPTANLICAFITMETPSADQEMKMVGFTQAVGMMFDDTLALASAEVIDKETRESFELFFDDLMDGHLIRRYRVGDKKLPKSLKHIERGLELGGIEETFVLTTLARVLTSTEVSVDDIYVDIQKAIEGEYILPLVQYIHDDEHLKL